MPTAARVILDTEAEAVNALLTPWARIGTGSDEPEPAGSGVARLEPGNRPLGVVGVGRDEGDEVERS
ncbi:hypothetical protein CBI38_33705 (plasmid) [Rhodococcus oxybenzonivorans]|uniref:Uncharacterized protein n=1 Tax=Rhodococcus oxybenzonivorans TaxID=1990687 RepID=A0A2S2C655_9NOCA|nr:hypothetical protein CBI38_33705 [Rhodococcus oxybenzonivorans]